MTNSGSAANLVKTQKALVKSMENWVVPCILLTIELSLLFHTLGSVYVIIVGEKELYDYTATHYAGNSQRGCICMKQ